MKVNSPSPRSIDIFPGPQGLFTLQCYLVASISFLYYDHIITFPEEVRKIWKRRLSILNILFIINRYTTFFGYIPITYFIFNSPSDMTTCNQFVRFPAILSIITQAIISVIVALRCYALYNGNRVIIVSVSVLGLVTMAFSIVATTKIVGIDLNVGGVYRTCVSDIVHGQNKPYKISWALSIVCDSAVFMLTLVKTVQMRRVHKFRGSYGSIANLFLRDGSIYFAVMAMSYIIHMIIFFLKNNSFFADSMGNNAFLTHTISVTMMSRLILNLNSYPDRHARQQEGGYRLEELGGSSYGSK